MWRDSKRKWGEGSDRQGSLAWRVNEMKGSPELTCRADRQNMLRTDEEQEHSCPGSASENRMLGAGWGGGR